MRVRKLDENNDMCFGSGNSDFVSGENYTTQRILTVLRLIKGEWFLDLAAGTEWFGKINGEHYNENQVALVIKNAILSVETVSEILEYNQIFNSETRALTITAKVQDNSGNTPSIGPVTI